MQLYDDFLVFPKMEDIKDAMIKSRVPKIFTGAVNIRNPGEGSNFYNLREYLPGDPIRKVNWKATARQDGKMMVNEFERDAVSDVIILVDSRAVSETGPVSRNSLVYNLELQRASPSTSYPGVTPWTRGLWGRDCFRGQRYGEEAIVCDTDKTRGRYGERNTPLKIVTTRIMPHIHRGSPIIILSPLEDDPTIVDAVRDLRARNFEVTVLSPAVWSSNSMRGE